MKRLFTLLLFCLTNLVSFSQTTYKAEEFQSALMQTKTGAIVVYTGQQHSFEIDIVGKITPSEKPNFVTVDNKILQSSIIPFQTKLDFENLSEDAQKKYLSGYMDYEMNYIKEQLKSKNLNEKSEFIMLGNKVFLFWSYDMPKSYKTVDNQCYLVSICFDQMLILNCPVDKGKTFKEVKDLLTNIGKTLKLNNHTIDLEKLYNKLNPK